MFTTTEISDTTITFQQLAVLVKPEDVKVLHLTNVELVGDEDGLFDLAMALRGHHGLAEVTLKNVTLNKEGLMLDLVVEMILISCHNLCVMNLNNVPVSAKSCATLAYCDSLTILSLVNNGFDDVDAKLIAHAVEANRSPLMSVDLSGNNIGDTGYKSLRLCVSNNMVIEEISLTGNRIGKSAEKSQTKTPTRVASSAA